LRNIGWTLDDYEAGQCSTCKPSPAAPASDDESDGVSALNAVDGTQADDQGEGQGHPLNWIYSILVHGSAKWY
jgi:hypothetical protein